MTLYVFRLNHPLNGSKEGVIVIRNHRKTPTENLRIYSVLTQVSQLMEKNLNFTNGER